MLKKIAAVAALAACACAQTPTTPAEYLPKLRLEDDKVYVQRINEALTPDGTLKIGVTAGSTVPFDQTVRYRADWYDANDLPIRTSVDNWNELKVSGNQPFEFVVVAPGARAKRYVIEIETN